MPPRFRPFLFAFRFSQHASGPSSAARLTQFLSQSFNNKFSTSQSHRLFQRAAKTVEKERKYNPRLLIYTAGDARTTWISFWKAVALLQCGTTLVFAVPPLWKNENQPDERVRKGQAILVGILGTIPTLTLAYFTAPFVHQIFLQIPENARRSRNDLMHFANSLLTKSAATANTKLEFTTLRIFPFRKNTGVFLHELRALPPRRLRLANIELPKSEAWAERQRKKGIWKRMVEVLSEPRYKFYVKEGKMYTMKTGVPGVWETVAERIQNQTKEEAEGPKAETFGRRPIVAPRVPTPIARAPIRRQTSRIRPK